MAKPGYVWISTTTDCLLSSTFTCTRRVIGSTVSSTFCSTTRCRRASSLRLRVIPGKEE